MAPKYPAIVWPTLRNRVYHNLPMEDLPKAAYVMLGSSSPLRLAPSRILRFAVGQNAAVFSATPLPEALWLLLKNLRFEPGQILRFVAGQNASTPISSAHDQKTNAHETTGVPQMMDRSDLLVPLSAETCFSGKLLQTCRALTANLLRRWFGIVRFPNWQAKGWIMELVYGHVWAIWWWRLTQKSTTADSLRTNRCALAEAPVTTAALKEADAYKARLTHVERGIPHTLPLELVSRVGKSRGGLAHVRIRRWGGHVPLGSICRAGENFVASPEFCFVLVACDIKRICQEKLLRWQYVVVLVELGCELCGTYSKRDTKRGFINRSVQLVATWQVRDFVCGVAHERGASLAYEALRWVIDALNSPMETVVYLMLCLPRAWGGLALPRPRANWALEVPEHLWNKTAKRHVIPDLYWPEWGLAVEFFGEDFHTGREREDRERQEIEQDMGLRVVTFWKDDVLDLRRFNVKAELVARYLGRCLPAMNAGFATLQAKLQAMLVRHQRWV